MAISGINVSPRTSNTLGKPTAAGGGFSLGNQDPDKQQSDARASVNKNAVKNFEDTSSSESGPKNSPRLLFPQSAFQGHGPLQGLVLQSLIPAVDGSVKSLSLPMVTQGVELAPLLSDGGDCFAIITDPSVVDWSAYANFARDTQNKGAAPRKWFELVKANRALYGWPTDERESDQGGPPVGVVVNGKVRDLDALGGLVPGERLLRNFDYFKVIEVPFTIPATGVFDGHMMACVDPITRIGYFTRATSVNASLGNAWDFVETTLGNLFKKIVEFAVDVLTYKWGDAIGILEDAVGSISNSVSRGDAAQFAKDIIDSLNKIQGRTTDGAALTQAIQNSDYRKPTPPPGGGAGSQLLWLLVGGVLLAVALALLLSSKKET